MKQRWLIGVVMILALAGCRRHIPLSTVVRTDTQEQAVAAYSICGVKLGMTPEQAVAAQPTLALFTHSLQPQVPGFTTYLSSHVPGCFCLIVSVHDNLVYRISVDYVPDQARAFGGSDALLQKFNAQFGPPENGRVYEGVDPTWRFPKLRRTLTLATGAAPSISLSDDVVSHEHFLQTPQGKAAEEFMKQHHLPTK